MVQSLHQTFSGDSSCLHPDIGHQVWVEGGTEELDRGGVVSRQGGGGGGKHGGGRGAGLRGKGPSGKRPACLWEGETSVGRATGGEQVFNKGCSQVTSSPFCILSPSFSSLPCTFLNPLNISGLHDSHCLFRCASISRLYPCE